jgi:hypothetical protein
MIIMVKFGEAPNVMNPDFGGLLNKSTPFAPTSEEEISERLAGINTGQPANEEKVAQGTVAGPADLGGTGSQRTGESEKLNRAGLSTAFVPTTREVTPGELPEYELRVMEDGTAGLAVFTSIERLRESLGESQHCTEASLLELLYLVGNRRIGVALNPRLDPQLAPKTETGREEGI